MGRRVSLNANVFYSDFDDFQNASFLGATFLVRNAEEVSSKGFEIDTVALLSEWLTLDFSYTYADTKYERFTHGPCYFGKPAESAEGTCDLSGRSLPLAPKNRYHLGAMGQWAKADGETYARVDYSWTDSVETDNGLDPRAIQGSYSLINARIGWRNDKWDLAAWIKNATDETVVTLTGPQTLIGGLDGGQQVFLNDPQSYGITVKYRF